MSIYDNPLARQLFTTKEIQEMSNINERSQPPNKERPMTQLSQEARREMLGRMLYEFLREAMYGDFIMNSASWEQIPHFLQESLRHAAVLFADKVCPGHAGLVEALEKCRHELNVIRARDGVPYTHYHMKSDVDEQYFSDVIDKAEAALAQAKGEA